MTRAISAATLAALEANTATPIYFIEIRIDETASPQVITRLHSGLGTITWGGFAWTGAGSLLSIDTIQESAEINPSPFRASLSGVDSTITNIVFGQNYYQRPCLCYIGALDDGGLIEDPSEIFSGFILKIDMSIGDPNEGDKVVLNAESELMWFQRSRNVRYTDRQLQSEYSGDVGLSMLEAVLNGKVVWRGRKNRMGSSGSGLAGTIRGAAATAAAAGGSRTL